MKKCPCCKVIYKDDGQFKCLYCDGTLMNARDVDLAEETETSFGLSKPKELKFNETLTRDRQDYLMGVFFRGSTFLSSFRFNLIDFKKGKEVARFFVRPLDLSTIIKIPWILVTLVYSAFYYFFPKRYCSACGWKYIPSHGEKQHDPQECAYNQEYNLIEKEVFSGKVFIDFREVKKISDAKIKAGQRSALYDLQHRNLPWEKTLDIFAILVSIIVYVYLLSLLVMPIANEIYHFDAI